MTQWHMKSGRKPTGGVIGRNAKKKKRQAGRDFIPCHVGKAKATAIRARGVGKRAALSADTANIIADGKSQKAKITGVVQNPADSQFIRRNIITKGAIISTELGKARVTSRPGQHGTINAVLVEAKEKPVEKQA